MRDGMAQMQFIQGYNIIQLGLPFPKKKGKPENRNIKMKTDLKVGIVGSGFAANFHYNALQYVNSAIINHVGIYSLDKCSCEKFASEKHITAYDDLHDLIRDVDVVHVCVPPSSHEEIVVKALKENKNVIVEKPFTGFFGEGLDDFNGDTFSKEYGLKMAMESVERMLAAEKQSQGRIFYAENWIYAPAIRKEKEIIEKSSAQILWMYGEQSHSGSHSLSYGDWKQSGGGSLIGKGCHPLTAALYLKQVEGLVRKGKEIRPVSVSARVHALTRLDTYENRGYIKDHYIDIEDLAAVHVVFDDGTVADIFANELSLGGTNNWLRVNANNHRTLCNMSHNDSMEVFTPDKRCFESVYLVEKVETQEGWNKISPDEGWFLGYQHELNAFYSAIVNNSRIESNSLLAADTIAVVYSAYVSSENKGLEVVVPLVL